jgi:hypothetical protein
MTTEAYAKLETLLSGKTDLIEIESSSEMSREMILDDINSLIISLFPGSWTKGHFINDDRDYIVYELNLIGSPSLSCLRLFDFGDMFRIVKI